MAIRLANRAGRAVLLSDSDGTTRASDLERASGGRFGADPMAAFGDWDAIRDAAPGFEDAGEPCHAKELGPCVPAPKQVFAIGLNYRDHAEEAGLPIPETPMVFTKFPSCIAGPTAEIPIFSETTDWEAELVVVIGRRAESVSEAAALDHVAGFCVGQDVSDRRLQFATKPPQFSLGKSRPGFGPIGPAVVGLDALSDPADLAIHCDLDGERMQSSRTSNLIFDVPSLVAYLSRFCALEPGDLIFTGTPSGVGSVRDPRRFMKAGETLVTEIEGLGKLENACVAPA